MLLYGSVLTQSTALTLQAAVSRRFPPSHTFFSLVSVAFAQDQLSVTLFCLSADGDDWRSSSRVSVVFRLHCVILCKCSRGGNLRGIEPGRLDLL